MAVIPYASLMWDFFLFALMLSFPIIHSSVSALATLPHRENHNNQSYFAIAVNTPSRIPVSSYVDALLDASITFPQFNIIVFPEDGIVESCNTPEFIGAVGDVPCEDDRYGPVVRLLSCTVQAMGRDASYVVFGLREHGENCTSEEQFCHNGKFFIYNTVVALGPLDGSIVAKYQKRHITGPPFRPGPPDPVYFETVFGVRFGMFICFDIYFHVPAQTLVEENHLRVTDFAYPTMFWDVVPLTSLPMQQGWSAYFQTNFVAANCGQFSARGSGVFSQGEVLVQSRKVPVPPLSYYELLGASVPMIEWVPPPFIPLLPVEKGPFVDEFLEKGFSVVPGSGGKYEASLDLSTFRCSVSFELEKKSTNERRGMGINKGEDDDEEAVFVLLYSSKYNDTAEVGQWFRMLECGLVVCGSSRKDCFQQSSAGLLFEFVYAEVNLLADEIRAVEGLVSLVDEFVLVEDIDRPAFVQVHEGVNHVLSSTENLPAAQKEILSASLTGFYQEYTLDGERC